MDTETVDLQEIKRTEAEIKELIERVSTEF